MSTTVNVINSLVGPSHVLTEDDISNWVDVIDLIDTTPCAFELKYNDVTYTGSIAKTVDELTILVGFDSELIALPGGMCLIADCSVVVGEDPTCYPTRVFRPLKLDDGILITDLDGCVIGHSFMSDLIVLIRQHIDVPGSLCELIGSGAIPTGNLVASDRILTTSSIPNCSLKSVPQSDVVCP